MHSIVEYTQELKSYFSNKASLANAYTIMGENGAKNLFPYPYKDGENKTIAGVTFSVDENGVITTSGTSTEYCYYDCATDLVPFMLPAGDYIFSDDRQNAETSTIYFVVTYKTISPSTSQSLGSIRYGNPVSFTITPEMEAEFKNNNAWLLLRLASNANPNGINWENKFYPMIRPAEDTSAKWEPPGVKNNKELTRNVEDITNGTLENTVVPCFSMFNKFGIIGDSYSSGHIAVGANNTTTINRTLSWGQVLARLSGNECYLFTKTGETTQSWLTDTEYGKAALEATEPLDFYIVCLGLNDYFSGTFPLGSESDIGTNAETFYGYYSQIIEIIQNHAPNARIMVSTMRKGRAGGHSPFTAPEADAAIITIAQHYGLPYIEPSNDPLFTSDYYIDNMNASHPVAQVYSAMATAFKRLIEKSMKDNFEYFKAYIDASPIERAVKLSTLQTVVAASSDFADFQTRIAAL